MNEINIIGGAVLGVLALVVTAILAVNLLPFIALFIIGFSVIKLKKFFNK
jgi:hypothetical protein|tara:strand:+ start:238 stop:387 length:150 start_codon:yes stop_codon:yes gene_type:complete